MGTLDKDGYGVLCRNQKGYSREQRAPRISWIIHFEEIPYGLQVLHRCDNRACVNPEHLWIGTGADNMRDKTEKGRNNMPKGEDVYASKLSVADVIEIRKRHASGEVQRRIAEDFNVGFKAINKIVLRQRWTHV